MEAKSSPVLPAPTQISGTDSTAVGTIIAIHLPADSKLFFGYL